MKRFLLSVLAVVCVSIGAWAEGDADGYWLSSDTWRSQTVNQMVAKIHLTKANVLAAAITEINTGVTKDGCVLKDAQVVYINGESIGDDDLAALSTLNYETIMLNDVTWTAASKSFSNVYVKYLILPDGWTKSEVNAIGVALATGSQFATCLSLGDFNEDVCYDGQTQSKVGCSLIAYVGKGNTLDTAIQHTYIDHKDSKLGINQYNGKISQLYEVAISGYPVARDMSAQTSLDFTADGHIVFNEPADETKYGANDYNMGITGTRYPVGDGIKEAGALQNVEVVRLDLSDAIIYPQWNEDLNLSVSFLIGKTTKRVDIPTSPIVDTLPADFLNCDAPYITQICIPGNIKNIKVRAFQHIHLYHVWTSPMEGYITDHGVVTAVDANKNETRVNDYLPYDACDIEYGSITLPPYLELIESAAFQGATEIKDVYSLNPIAPECHVDAFNTLEYVANDHYNSASIDEEGIITRDAYRNSGTWKWMTILHYPRESVAPDIQRYTDPTRRYSIASGDKDGNGATIYYPNQDEYNRSYLQGTTGYLWNSWDTTRELYNNGFENTTIESDLSKTQGYSDYYQQTANSTYESNTMAGKALTSFYDVTAGGQYSQPSGLTLYSTVYWDEATYSLNTEGRGVPLYPAAEYSEAYFKYNVVEVPDNFTGTLYVKNGDDYEEATGAIDPDVTYYSRVQTQAINADGTLKYEECEDGEYVIGGYNYVEAENGGYVQEANLSGYDPTTSAVDGVTTYYDANHSEVTPKIGSGLYVENGTENIYCENAVYAPVEGVSVYYKKVGNEYVETLLEFQTTYYYSTGNQVPKGYVKEWYSGEGKTYYILVDGEYVLAENPGWNNEYYVYYSELIDEYVATTNPVDGVTTYYYYGWQNGVQGYYVQDPVQYTGEYYYVTGTRTVYASAQGLDYDSSITYYSDQEGTEATSIAFDDTYYVPVYEYTYRAYTEEDGDAQQWKQIPYYVKAEEGETGAYCPVMVDAVFRDLLKKNDYRGWHQFVMAANASNSDVPFETLKSFITDNDWWTICVPYNLTYSDMVYLFGDKANSKIPYLSKLLYVVRDVENTHITLMFSKNLMVYKEQFLSENGTVTGYEQFPDAEGKISGRVHGYIDETDAGKWSDEEIARDPIILHAGVPYMIRPEIPVGGARQFDIYKQEQLTQDMQASLKPNAIVSDGMWERLNAAKNLSGDEQKELVYNGEYKVPAYVINNASNGEGTKGDNSSTITMKDGSTFTYPALNGEDTENQFKFKGNYYKMEISDEFDYTFVGSFYKSLMPQYCYFLGWNAQAQKAAFWYNRVNDNRNWNWNNETGIICANWDLNKEINAAEAKGFLPARWVVEANTDIVNDDFGGGNAASAKGYMPMAFGNGMNILLNVVDDDSNVVSDNAGLVDAIDNVNAGNGEAEWYNINGQKLNRKPVNNGVYIVNGKKYVVK